MKHAIVPCLWFDNQAEKAADFYISVFKNGSIKKITRYGKEGYEVHGQKEGTALTVEFEINGQTYTALNGGPLFKFTEAISFQVTCDTQEEIDYYWNALLTSGGVASQCGWLKDQYGLSWQIVPAVLAELLSDPATAPKVTKAFLAMQKFEIEKLKQAAL